MLETYASYNECWAQEFWLQTELQSANDADMQKQVK